MGLHKKGQVLDNIGGLVTSLGVIAILIAVIFLIMAESKDMVLTQDPCNISTYWFNSSDNTCCLNSTYCATTTGLSKSYTAQQDVQGATSDIPGWLSIVVITIIGGILLTLVRLFRR